MIPDNTLSPDAGQAADAFTAQAAETTQAAVADTAADLGSATAAVADKAQEANQDAAKAATAFAGSTADAFGAARERLNAVAGALPASAQDAFRPFQAGGDAFGKGIQSSYTSTVEGMAEFNSKAIAAWRSNAESTLAHWQNLAGVKSLSEAIALSAEHTRQQLEAVTAQTRELSSLATRIVRDATSPFKTTDR